MPHPHCVMWGADTPHLSLAQQALSAAHALQLGSAGAAADELAPWEAAPYVDAVLAQPSSAPVLRALCSLLRCCLLVTMALCTLPGLHVPRPT